MKQKILKEINNAITNSIVENLSGYNNPLSNVISDNRDDLYKLINTEFKGLLFYV